MAGDNSQEALESAHDYVLTRIEMADHSSDAEYELEEVLYKALRQKEERYVCTIREMVRAEYALEELQPKEVIIGTLREAMGRADALIAIAHNNVTRLHVDVEEGSEINGILEDLEAARQALTRMSGNE